MKKARALLAQVEQHLVVRQPAQAMGLVCDLLHHHRVNLARAFSEHPVSETDFRQFCIRFSAAWSSLCRHPDWNPLTEPQLSRFLCDLTEFYALVGCNPSGNLDEALIAQLGTYQRSQQAADLLKLMLLWTPMSEAWPEPFRYFANSRAVVLAQALATIASMIACSPRADASRNAALELLASGRVLPAELVPFLMQPVFMSAWFRSSYATHPDKHAIKRTMNAAIGESIRCADAAGPPPPPRAVELVQRDARPRIVLPLEWAFREGGAMYRCYAPVIRELRRHFFTIGLSERRMGDHTTAALFDAHFHYEDLAGEDLTDVRTLAAAIRTFEPAVVFYPSVGMVRIVVMLANMRLAPVQAMTVGHPATSGSPVMDYMLAESSFAGSPDIFTENFVPVADGALAFDAPAVDAAVESVVRPGQTDDGRVHVAVPAVSHKISWPFLRTLQAVERAAPGRFVFHFFTGLSGTCYYQMRFQVTRALRTAHVYPALDYQPYIAAVHQCHVHAASFPFGGTNSLIDSLRQGLPVVALRGREVHERIDAEFVRRLGLENELVAGNEAAYGAILLRFANEPGFLGRMRERVVQADVGALLMRNGRPDLFVAALAGLKPRAGGS